MDNSDLGERGGEKAFSFSIIVLSINAGAGDNSRSVWSVQMLIEILYLRFEVRFQLRPFRFQCWC